MSYLDLKNASILREHSLLPRDQNVLTLRMEASLLARVVEALHEAYAENTDQTPARRSGAELRIALPEQWILFWKQRLDDSRALLAHPSPDEWVVTFALDAEYAKKLLFSLKNLQPGQSLKLSEIGPLHTVSNLELIFVIL